jgi:hypothetical protein
VFHRLGVAPDGDQERALSRRSAAAAVAAIVAVVVVVLGLGLGWWTGAGGGAAAVPSTPLAATAGLEPAQVFFGDPVDATVTVVLDRTDVKSSTVRVEPSFAPYAPSGTPAVTRTVSGSFETLRYAYTLVCVNDGCLPGTTPRNVQFPPAAVRAGTRTAHASWPELVVSSRLGRDATASGTPTFVAPTALPAVRFAVAPGALADALTAAAGLLAAVAMILLAREASRYRERRRRGEAARRTPLEVALAFAREAAHRPVAADRRKALGLLAEVLDERGDATLAASADAAAWGESPPDGERLLSFADEVESETTT